MAVGKIYKSIELRDLNYHQTYMFKEYNRYLSIWVNLSEFKGEDGILNKSILEMLYPGYPWEKIAKLYKEAPRIQK